MFMYIGILIVFVMLYVLVVRPRIRTYKYIAHVTDIIDSGALTWWDAIRAKFLGSKTVVLSGLAGIIPGLPAFLDQIKEFTGWAAFFEQGTANKIAAACAALAMVTHAIGMESAAKSEPKK